MGLRDIERKITTKSAYQRKEAELLLQELDQLIENVETLKKDLRKFEKKHGKDIQSNKDYYEKISLLREELGLPEEVGIYDWKDSPSFTDRLRGKGYFDQLGQEIMELGKTLISETGGLISVAELVIRVNKVRPGKLVPPKYIIKALDSLVDAKLIQPLRKLPSGVLVVEFIAIELSEDQKLVFDIAAKRGFLTRETLIMYTNWSPERTARVLEELIKEGIALKDETYHEGVKYWFPSLGQ
jgi:hypothetical protein